jgi:hypothetical protein
MRNVSRQPTKGDDSFWQVCFDKATARSGGGRNDGAQLASGLGHQIRLPSSRLTEFPWASRIHQRTDHIRAPARVVSPVP